MKKIYLFSVALLAFVVSSVAQTNPPGCPTGIAWKNTSNDPFPHCYVNFVNPALVGQTGWQIGLLDVPGANIPLLGTGYNTGNPPDYWVDISSVTGGATFAWDCNNPLAVKEGTFVLRYIPDAQTPFFSCTYNLTDAAPTPVKLTSFTGRLQNDNSVTLDWTSSVEWDSYKYEVQRSADGIHFESVGQLNAAGAANTTIKYTYKDQLPSSGAFFYRLKQLDFSGAFEYSKVVYVNSKKGAGVITKIFPNPFKGEIQLIGATSSDLAPNNIGVYSIGGQKIPYHIIGANAISIDPSAPDGVYILKVKDQHFKIVKSKSASTAF